jgi:hypothetical protein
MNNERRECFRRPCSIARAWPNAWRAIRASDISRDLMPERRDFPEAEYLEFGWGDWDFYQTSSFNSGNALKALLLSTNTVLHVVAFSGPVTRYAPYREIIAPRPPSHGFQYLVGRARGPRGATRRHGGRLGRLELVEDSLFVSESRWEIRGGRRRRQCPRPALSPSNSTGYPGSLPLSNPTNDTSLP